MPWVELVKSVDSYLSTMYDKDHVPMEVDAAFAKTTCLCCGKTGLTKQNCRFKDAECRKCGKKLSLIHI